MSPRCVALVTVFWIANPNADIIQEKNEEKVAWCSQFLSRGGVKYLVNTLIACDFFDSARGSKRKVCLSLLLKIINFFAVGNASTLGFMKNWERRSAKFAFNFARAETQTINDGMETVTKLRGDVLLSCTDGKVLITRILELGLRAATDVEKPEPSLINPLAPLPELVRLSFSSCFLGLWP